VTPLYLAHWPGQLATPVIGPNVTGSSPHFAVYNLIGMANEQPDIMAPTPGTRLVSLEWLAKEMGLSPRKVGYWLGGIRVPRIKIADKTYVNLASLEFEIWARTLTTRYKLPNDLEAASLLFLKFAFVYTGLTKQAIRRRLRAFFKGVRPDIRYNGSRKRKQRRGPKPAEPYSPSRDHLTEIAELSDRAGIEDPLAPALYQAEQVHANSLGDHQ